MAKEAKMAHNIDMTGNRANIAFLGSRNDIWHKLGQEMKPDMSIAEWAKAAGLEWSAIKVSAFYFFNDKEMTVEGMNHIIRNDTGHALGYVSDRYQPVQPSQILAWFEQYISVDDRFKLDVAGSLKQGEIIWATATFNGVIKVGGDDHVMRMLMSTTFDGTGSTINKGCATRVVCNNTFDTAMAEKNVPVVKTRHNTKFNADRVGAELGNVAKSFEAYKAMGDAMAIVHMSQSQVETFFKAVLGIDKVAADEVSTNKLNQLQGLDNAYRATLAEGTEGDTAWCALNAVTRYVDHDRSTRGGNSLDEAKFLSSQFGSGAMIKSRAVELLKELCKV